MKKLNCWEYMQCGKGCPSKTNDSSRGSCVTSTEKTLDGVHGGLNAGRACWAATAKTCRRSCGCRRNCFKSCNFYVKVRIEEGMNFKTPTLLAHMRGQQPRQYTTLLPDKP